MKNIIENSCDKISLFLFFRNYLSDNERDMVKLAKKINREE